MKLIMNTSSAYNQAYKKLVAICLGGKYYSNYSLARIIEYFPDSEHRNTNK